MTLRPHIFRCGFLAFLDRTFLEVISFSSTCSGSVLVLTYDSAPAHSFPRRMPCAEPGPAKTRGLGPTQQPDCLEDVPECSVMTQKAQVLGPWVDRKTSLLVCEHLFFMALVPPHLGPTQLPAWMPHSFVRTPSHISRPPARLAVGNQPRPLSDEPNVIGVLEESTV